MTRVTEHAGLTTLHFKTVASRIRLYEQLQLHDCYIRTPLLKIKKAAERIEILTRDYNSLKVLLALPDPSIELTAKFSLTGSQLEFGDDIISDGLPELIDNIYDINQ